MDVKCPKCSSVNPMGNDTCFICGSSLKALETTEAASHAPRGSDLEEYRLAMGDERHLLLALGLLYRLYAVGYAALVLIILIGTGYLGLPMPTRVVLALLPGSSLVLVLIARRRMYVNPFPWALTMAGMESLGLAQALYYEGLPKLRILSTVVLWLAVFATARAARIRAHWREGRRRIGSALPDLRVALALFLLYGGVFLLIALCWDLDERAASMRIFYGGLIVFGAVAAWTAGGRTLRKSFPLRMSFVALPLTVLGLLVSVGVDTVFLSWIKGAWLPEIPTLVWPGADVAMRGAMFPGLFEEWYCRGVMWECVRSRASQATTIIATSTLFALMHGLGRGGGLWLVVPQLIGGLIFGILRARTGSLVPGMVVHTLGNLYLHAWDAGQA